MRSSPHGTRRVAAALLLLSSAAAPLGAQGPYTFEGFATRRQSSESPLFGGLAWTGYQGPWGLRLGGALHLVDANQDGSYAVPVTQCGYHGCRTVYRRQWRNESLFGKNVGAWTADADLIFAPLRALPWGRAVLLGFSPYGFVGIGTRGERGTSFADTSRFGWSYGAGLQHDLVGALGVSAEARVRRSFGDGFSLTRDLRDAAEYRVGLAVSVGRRGATPSAASAAATAVTSAPPAPVVPDEPLSEDAQARLAARVLDAADALVGTPYRAGGASERGFDGPGFIQAVYASEGIALPRELRELANSGTEVSTRVGALRPGDLLFFGAENGGIDHVAIYAGRERIIHASESGNGVRYDVLGEGDRGRWYAERLVRARRVTGLARTRARQDESDAQRDRAPRPDRPDR